MSYTLLDHINSPADVKALKKEQLPLLCEEIRRCLIDAVSHTGGHLAPNLGVVELTVALHRVFDSPADPIMWDVGHQCYTHKILTGRKDKLMTLRQKDGLSGFPRPSESEHDPFVSGHASTAVSVAYGVARAKAIKYESGTAVAVVGDGALTGGLAYEGLNNAGSDKSIPMVVVINDNERSISRSVGAIARHLSRIRSNPGYIRTKGRVERLLRHIPLLGRPLLRFLQWLKTLMRRSVVGSTIFADLGFAYYGLVDGHNLDDLVTVLTIAKELRQPVIVHVQTVKGKGYEPAEQNPGAYHSTAPFSIDSGDPDTSAPDSFSFAFGHTLVEYAKRDDSLCAITAAMKFATGLMEFRHTFPDRFFDVGIAEGHAVTFGASLASRGLRPVLCVYSTFAQRAFDELIHDAAIMKNNLVLGIDRAGIVGDDGETHQGLFDVPMFRTIPGVTIYSPTTYGELAPVLGQALYRDEHGVKVIRYPRGSQPADEALHAMDTVDYHVSETPGADTLIVSYGRLVKNAYDAAAELTQRGIPTSLCKLTRILPLGGEVIDRALAYNTIVFAEEGMRAGGVGEDFGYRLMQKGYKGRYHIRAVEGFVPAATPAESLRDLGLDAASLTALVEELRHED